MKTSGNAATRGRNGNGRSFTFYTYTPDQKWLQNHRGWLCELVTLYTRRENTLNAILVKVTACSVHAVSLSVQGQSPSSSRATENMLVLKVIYFSSSAAANCNISSLHISLGGGLV